MNEYTKRLSRAAAKRAAANPDNVGVRLWGDTWTQIAAAVPPREEDYGHRSPDQLIEICIENLTEEIPAFLSRRLEARQYLLLPSAATAIRNVVKWKGEES
jgi:hypothetical protein